MFHICTKRCREFGVVVVTMIALVAGITAIAFACDTPVYRYATYNWTPSPYRIYYIARGEKLAADDSVRRAIVELTTSPTDAPRAVANLELVEIDAATEKPLESLPPPVRDEAGFIMERATATEGGAAPQLPRFAVVLPNGYPVYEGPLTGGDVRAIADSPARRKLVELIAGGKAAVMVLLDGEKAEDNAAAEKLIAATIARAADGELSPAPDFTLSTTPPDAKPAAVDVGTIRVRRDDPAEKWLVMSLLHLEPEIDERTEPMVFMAYARGRVSPPAIGVNLGEGRGICDEQLDQQIKFVLGPCACTVKHENPGMDLALVAQWDEIALAMAKKHGSETGNERLLGEVPGLFPEIVDVGVPTAEATPKATDRSEPEPSRPATDAVVADAAAEKASNGSTTHARPADRSPVAAERPVSDAPESFETGMSLEEATRKDSGNATLMRNVGIGVLVAVVLLGAASMALFRRPA